MIVNCVRVEGQCLSGCGCWLEWGRGEPGAPSTYQWSDHHLTLHHHHHLYIPMIRPLQASSLSYVAASSPPTPHYQHTRTPLHITHYHNIICNITNYHSNPANCPQWNTPSPSQIQQFLPDLWCLVYWPALNPPNTWDHQNREMYTIVLRFVDVFWAVRGSYLFPTGVDQRNDLTNIVNDIQLK